MERVVLLRYGEIFLKKGNRPLFLKRLRRNLIRRLEFLLPGNELDVVISENRLEISAKGRSMSDEELATSLQLATHSFGIVSASPALRVPPSVEAIEQAALKVYEEALGTLRANNFRVETRRADKHFPMTSPQFNQHLGGVLIDRHPLPVNLTQPDLTVGINILTDRAYAFAQRIEAPGGLPTGMSGKGVLLLSGGIDSPVAGWMMAKRGMLIPAVHFHSFPYTTRQAMTKVYELAEVLASFVGPMHLTSICLTPIQEFLAEKVPKSLLVLFYRRSMMRIATRIGQANSAQALITGESLAQVASQTIENMTVVEQATTLPVLRPLVGMDKDETVVLARRIGTYEASIKPYNDACTLFLPKRPETKAKLPIFLRIEEELGEELNRLEQEALDTKEEFWFARKEKPGSREGDDE